MQDLYFKNYENLEKHIDEFLLSNTKTLIKNTKSGKITKKYINIKSLLELNLSDEYINYALCYIKRKNIFVLGVSENDYQSYNKKFNPIIKELQKNRLSESEQLELFKKYNKTRDINLRNTLVENYLALVDYALSRISYFYNLDYEELYQYGYEALIEATEKFDITKNVKFVNFACDYIFHRAIYFYARDNACGSYLKYTFSFFKKTMKAVEKEFDKEFDILDNEMFEYFLTCMMENNNLSNMTKEELKRNILILENISLEELTSNGYDIISNDETDLYNRVFIGEIIEKTNISDLNKIVLLTRYGLVDGKYKSVNETGEIFNVKHQRISQIEKQAFKKMRKKLNYIKDEIKYNYSESFYQDNHRLIYTNN